MEKIIGKVNGAVGIIKEIKQDTHSTARGRTYLSEPYAVIEWKNGKRTGAYISYLKALAARGVIEII